MPVLFVLVLSIAFNVGGWYGIGFLDKLPVDRVRDFETRALESVKANHPEFLAEIVKEKKISDELESKLMQFYQKFTEEYTLTIEKAA